ncbi:DoxX family protein [Sungkyunkwania multivorans]|uniref:DoxX family protein n=1 Tax=Sungkyunkwania multivorans TaxID=1173618 RepID=A0ABW3CX04_9FLAO
MGTVKTLNKWANAHTYIPLDIIRIALGVFLFIKGTAFVTNIQSLVELVQPLKGWGGTMLLMHYIAPAHMVGGVMIAFGLLTRWSTLSQIPILVGAVMINFVGEMQTGNFITSIIVLMLLVFFTVYGSGKHSADYYFKMQQ